MIKRSELAICDIKNPDVLCIDEPLNYLDKEGIEILEDLLNIKVFKKKVFNTFITRISKYFNEYRND